MRKKIAYVSTEWFVDTDITVVHELAKVFDVKWVYCTNVKNPRFPINKINDYVQRNNIALRVVDGKGLKYLDSRQICVAWQIVRAIREFKPDLIYQVGCPNIYRIPLEMLFLRRGKVLRGIHDVQTHSGVRGAALYKLTYMWMFWWTKKFVVFSKTQFDLFKSMYEKKDVALVGMSVKDFGDPKCSRPPIKNGVNLLFFGRIDSYKGLDMFIRQFEKNIEQGMNRVTLSICGKGPHWHECEKLIKHTEYYRLNIRFIEDEEVPELMMSHHFLVLPYRDATQSGPIMIAANYGLPIIATDFQCFKNVYGEEAGYFGSYEEMGQILSAVANLEQSEYEKMLRNVDVIAEKFSMKLIAQNYERLFCSLMGI